MRSDANFCNIYPRSDSPGFQDMPVSLTRKESFEDLVQVVGFGFEPKNVCGLEALCFPKDDGGIILSSSLGKHRASRDILSGIRMLSLQCIRVPARKVANKWPLLCTYSN